MVVVLANVEVIITLFTENNHVVQHYDWFKTKKRIHWIPKFCGNLKQSLNVELAKKKSWRVTGEN